MRLKKLFILALLLCMTILNCTLGEECTFRKTPERLVQVSDNHRPKVKIVKHFELNDFDEFCLLKVKLPQGTIITFNLTKKLDGEKYFGDKLKDQIWVNKNRDLVYFKNTTEEFGQRFGLYFINGFEVLGTYYYDAQPVVRFKKK